MLEFAAKLLAEICSGMNASAFACQQELGADIEWIDYDWQYCRELMEEEKWDFPAP